MFHGGRKIRTQSHSILLSESVTIKWQLWLWAGSYSPRQNDEATNTVALFGEQEYMQRLTEYDFHMLPFLLRTYKTFLTDAARASENPI
jgi:hypothetical protein